MRRAVDGRRGGAVAQDLVQEEPGDARRVCGIGELLLLDEGVTVEPLEQLRAIGRDHPRLRIVDVGIDQAGQDQAVRVVIDCRPRRHFRQQVRGVACPSDPPVLDHQQTVGLIPIARCRPYLGRIIEEFQQRAAYGASVGGHGRQPSCHSIGAPAAIQAASICRSSSDSSVMLPGGMA